MEVADICCQGRVISILEGGYGSTADLSGADNQSNGNVVGKTDGSKTKKLDKSIFSDCAVRHLGALIDPYDVEKKYPTGIR